MFEYNICKEASNEEFKKACNKIEQNISNLSTGDPLVDVDGSVVKVYKSSNDTIKVFNDYEVDAVWIESTINLNRVLKQKVLRSGRVLFDKERKAELYWCESGGEIVEIKIKRFLDESQVYRKNKCFFDKQ